MASSNASRTLRGGDLCFLAWESPARPMHIAVRAEFQCAPGASPPTTDELRAFFQERIQGEPRLRSRLRRRLWPRRPIWEPVDGVRIEDHVRELPPSGLPDRVREDAVLRAPLAEDRPLWEIWHCPEEGERFHLILKVHHVLVDGIAGVALLERLLGGAERPRSRRAKRPSPKPRSRSRAATGPGAVLRFVREHLRSADRSPLNGRVERRRHFWTTTDADDFMAACRLLGGSPNDGVLAAVSGALRRWLARESSGRLPAGLRALCPVSLRGAGEVRGYGNRVSAWFVPLPIDEADPAARVQSLRERTAERKREGAHGGGEGASRWVGRLGAWLAGAGMGIAAWRRAFSVVVTNVPGPSRPLELQGARLTALVPFAPLYPGQRLSVALLRYDGRLFFGATAGWQDRQRGVRFETDLAQELERIRSLAQPDAAA